MNRQLFRDIADAIEADPHSYNQHTFVSRSDASECGTSACIAGWAVLLTDREAFMEYAFHGKTPTRQWDIEAAGRKALGISIAESDIFGCGFNHNATTAAPLLRKFADDGKVDVRLWESSEPDHEE